MNSVQTLKTTELLGHEFNSHPGPILSSYSNFIFYSVFRVHFVNGPCQSPYLPQVKPRTDKHMNIVEWTDTCGIHHLSIFRSIQL